MTPVTSPFRLPEAPSSQPSAAEPVAERVTITPEHARALLDAHEHAVEQNEKLGLPASGRTRALRRNDVAKYARDMRSNHWQLNGETIKITTTGIIADGNHRLHACIDAGAPFDTFLVTGVGLETQPTMDAGVRRKVSDQLTMRGEANAKALETIARWSWRWLRGARTRSGYAVQHPSELELLGFIDLDERLRLAAAFAVRAHRDFPRARMSVFGIAWMLFHGADYITAEVFLPRVADGADIGLGHPAHTLRARLMRAKDRDERLSEHEELSLFILAWNAYREDRQISQLSLPKGQMRLGTFPEPV